MIASRVGLMIISAIALVLALVLGIDLARDDAPASRALVPGFDPAKLARITWTRGAEGEITVVRAGAGWRLAEPNIPANPEAIDNAITALRGARWHRREAIAQAGTLRVAMTAGSVKIGVGQPLEGAAQTWVAIGDHAYLVDDWVARAFAPEPLALREIRPLRFATTAKTIVADAMAVSKFAVRIEGARMVRPIDVRLDPAIAGRLRRALAELTIVALPTQAKTDIWMTITIDSPSLVNVDFSNGGCADGQTRIGGTYGPGCIALAVDREIQKALIDLADPTTRIADPVPARVDPLRVTLADGSVLDLEKRPRVGDRDADPMRVAELLAVLSTAAEVVDDTTSEPQGTLAITDRAGETITLELLPNHRVRRKGELVALVLGEGSDAILRRPASALGDPTLWTEDPLTIKSITIVPLRGAAIGKTTFARGAVIGEWSAGDAAALTALAEALAHLRGTDIPQAPATTRTIAFEVVAPAGAPVTRTIEVGAKCHGRADNRSLAFDAALCAALDKVTP